MFGDYTASQIFGAFISLCVTLGVGAWIKSIIDAQLGKKKAAQEGISFDLKNLKESNELTDYLNKKAKEAAQEEVKKNEEIRHLQVQIAAQSEIIKMSSESVEKLSGRIGGAEKAEELCREQMKELKHELREEKEARQIRDDERHKETMKMFSSIKDLIEQRILPNEQAGV